MTTQHPGLLITGGRGPEHAPAGEPQRGLFTATPLHYEVLASGPQRVTIARVDQTVRRGDELVWAVFPVANPRARVDPTADFGRLFEATGVGVDLLLDDGSRLSAMAVPDQHGVGLSPTEQAASKTLSVDQWNLKRVSLAEIVGRRVTAVELATDTAAGSGWVECLGIGDPASGPLGAVLARDGTLAGQALTTRGSHSNWELSRGSTIPIAALPHSFTMVTPVTDPGSFGRPYSWHAGVDADATPALAAFAVTHLPSPWLGDHGVVQFFPVPPGTTGSVQRAGRAERRLRFRHAEEFARPHRYQVRFEDGTQAAIAPSSYALVAEFRSPSGVPAIVFDQLDNNGVLDLSRVASGVVSGVSRGASDTSVGALPLYFHAEFDRPIVRAQLLADDGRPAVHGLIEFDSAGDAVKLRLATSFISATQAEANLAEIPADRSVADVARAAAAAWDQVLGQVEVVGASEDATTTLRSCLYRMFLYPNLAHEPDGAGGAHYAHRRPDGQLEVVPGRRCVTNGFWDTYRTVWPALALLHPGRAATLVDGFVEHFRVDGWMPRWSSPGPANLMVGTSSDNIVADAIVNRLPLPDPEAAYRSALKNATVPASVPEVGRKGLATGIFRGYLDREVPEGLSWTLENAISDGALAAAARELAVRLPQGHPGRDERLAEADYFAARAANHALLFDPTTGFYRGREATGRFGDSFDPEAWGGDYTETNAWGMRFTAPHDGHGLAYLHGGPKRLGEHLDEFFAQPERATGNSMGAYRQLIHEMTEARNVRLGRFGPSNQPAHHIPFLYAFSDRPWQLDPIVRECVRRLFLGSEIGQGCPGDEDNGELSAWWFFLALGLYPLWSGSGEFVLSAPSFDRFAVSLPGGKRLVVETRGNQPGHDHLQAVSINGQPWTSRAVPCDLVAAGAEIVVTLGAEPTWAATASPPASLTRAGGAPQRLMDAAVAAELVTASGQRQDAATLIDNCGALDFALPAGATIELRFAEPQLPRLLTLTAGAEPGRAPSDWLVTALDGAELGRFQTQGFEWPRQTRPFRLASDAPVAGIRVRNLGAVSALLRQVEVLVESPPG